MGITILFLIIALAALLYKYKKLREKNMKYVLMTGDQIRQRSDHQRHERSWKPDRAKNKDLFFNEATKSKDLTGSFLPKRKYFD